ncbi:Maf family protein [Spiribacter roseus]|uniref:Maf family protein n=1 Tax=Spiribacter roseus TaxID=1855875 RepID=UPI001330094D|nr:nucleoside triphosphate pyrophosphatase [Spiribacter roseus]KAF0283284.1 septum formation protein Maf [Spiribacter roseus]
MASIILASSSPYRAELLRRLQIDFTTIAPNIDETRRPGETPETYVRRLAREKAAAVAADHPRAVVIGSDQCSECRGGILGKPGTVERAIDQLLAASGQPVTLTTAVAVHDPASGHIEVDAVTTDVRFRRLARAAIERYVHTDQPLDCAGAFRAEGLGISLFESIRTDDPNALIGLPLIALNQLLGRIGIIRP